MERNFSKNFLCISVGRTEGTDFNLSINSDYSDSQRKSQLYVNEKRLAEQVERFWKSIKTKKLVGVTISFDEEDYYTNETDMYTTPVVNIRRGLKKARIGTQTHGSIPKEWGFVLTCGFKDTTTVTPIIEAVKAALGSYFTEKYEKEFRKELRPFLQKKTTYANFSID